MAYWAGTTPVTEVELLSDYRAKTPAIRARVKLNGTELVALFDTGATTVVSARAARRAGVAEADMTPAGTIYGAGRGSARRPGPPSSRSSSSAARRSCTTACTSADFDLEDADMLLGIDFFLSHRIYVSKKQSKMFFTYNGGTVFALNQGRGRAAPSAFDADPAASGVRLATADQLARRGAASAARRDYESALADLDRACELEPTSAAFLAQRGAHPGALKRPAKALEDFDKALALDPAQADARFRRAVLRFSAQGSRRRARPTSTRSTRRSPRRRRCASRWRSCT